MLLDCEFTCWWFMWATSQLCVQFWCTNVVKRLKILCILRFLHLAYPNITISFASMIMALYNSYLDNHSKICVYLAFFSLRCSIYLLRSKLHIFYVNIVLIYLECALFGLTAIVNRTLCQRVQGWIGQKKKPTSLFTCETKAKGMDIYYPKIREQMKNHYDA